MPIKSYKPVTPTRRFQTVVSREDITKDRPEKSLIESKQSTGGRKNPGRITSRFPGGGHKKNYRALDFKRDKICVPANVSPGEAGPNPAALRAPLQYKERGKGDNLP